MAERRQEDRMQASVPVVEMQGQFWRAGLRYKVVFHVMLLSAETQFGSSGNGGVFEVARVWRKRTAQRKADELTQRARSWKARWEEDFGSADPPAPVGVSLGAWIERGRGSPGQVTQDG